MEPSKQDRRLPAVILAVSLALAIFCLLPSGGTSPGNAAVSLAAGGGAPDSVAALEKIIGEGRANSEVWTRYAHCQESAGAWRNAAQAYEMALKNDPVNHDLLFGRGVALARAGSEEDLYSFVFQLSLRDPRLTYDLLERPECKPFVSSDRFRKVYRDAYDQYLD